MTSYFCFFPSLQLPPTKLTSVPRPGPNRLRPRGRGRCGRQPRALSAVPWETPARGHSSRGSQLGCAHKQVRTHTSQAPARRSDSARRRPRRSVRWAWSERPRGARAPRRLGRRRLTPLAQAAGTRSLRHGTLRLLQKAAKTGSTHLMAQVLALREGWQPGRRPERGASGLRAAAPELTASAQVCGRRPDPVPLCSAPVSVCLPVESGQGQPAPSSWGHRVPLAGRSRAPWRVCGCARGAPACPGTEV